MYELLKIDQESLAYYRSLDIHERIEEKDNENYEVAFRAFEFSSETDFTDFLDRYRKLPKLIRYELKEQILRIFDVSVDQLES